MPELVDKDYSAQSSGTPPSVIPRLFIVGEVGLRGLARLMHLGKDQVTPRTVLSTPNGDVPLHGTQLESLRHPVPDARFHIHLPLIRD